jgi:hypothetical protein
MYHCKLSQAETEDRSERVGGLAKPQRKKTSLMSVYLVEPGVCRTMTACSGLGLAYLLVGLFLLAGRVDRLEAILYTRPNGTDELVFVFGIGFILAVLFWDSTEEFTVLIAHVRVERFG